MTVKLKKVTDIMTETIDKEGETPSFLCILVLLQLYVRQKK